MLRSLFINGLLFQVLIGKWQFNPLITSNFIGLFYSSFRIKLNRSEGGERNKRIFTLVSLCIDVLQSLQHPLLPNRFNTVLLNLFLKLQTFSKICESQTKKKMFRSPDLHAKIYITNPYKFYLF